MLRTLTVVVSCTVLGCIESGPRPSGDVEDQVGRFLESYRMAGADRDTAMLRTMYVDDGRFEWIEDGQVRYRSPDDVIAALASLPGDMSMSTEYDGIAVTLVGSTGARASMNFQTEMGEGSSAFQFGGMISLLLEQDPSGWRIVAGHTSTVRSDGY